MKIAVTGGAGFIGSRLCDALEKAGHQVIILDVQGENPVDVTDQEKVTEALCDVDVIYNLAAEHRDDVSPVSRYYDVNVKGARILVEAARSNDIEHIIFTSTVAVYGLNAGASSEADAPEPFNDYGQSKLDAEKVFEDWAAEDKRRSLKIMRLVATFGPGNRGNIYTLMRQIAGGKFVMIGRGDNYKSVAYVENVVQFLVHLMGQKGGILAKPGVHLYNYADKPDLNMHQMVLDIRRSLGLKGMGLMLPYWAGLCGGYCFDILAKITGRKFPISAVRVRKFCADTVVQSSKRDETGFQAPYDLKDGLGAMMEAEFIKKKCCCHGDDQGKED